MNKRISNQIVQLPDGKFNALWSAYFLEILSNTTNEVIITIPTIDGVRGMKCKTNIEIINGEVFQI